MVHEDDRELLGVFLDFFLFVEKEFLHASLAVLELTVDQVGLGTSCAGIKGMCHHAHTFSFILFYFISLRQRL